MSIYSIPALLTSFFTLGLGFIVFLKNQHSPINKLFALLCFETLYWQICWFISYFFNNPLARELIVRIAFSVIVFIPFTYYHFTIVFLNIKSQKVKIFFSYLFGAIFLLLIWTSNIFIAGYRDFWWGYYPKAGGFFAIYLVGVFFFMFEALRLIKNALKISTNSINKNKIKYIAITLFLYFFATTEYAIDYGVPLYPIATFLFTAGWAIVAYAILRHRLMDITVIIRKGVVYPIIVAILTGAYLSVLFVLGEMFHVLSQFSFFVISIFSIFALALIFQPLKSKLQRYIDKTFFHEKYLLEKSLKEFAEASTTIIDLNELLSFITKSLKNSLSAKHIQILLLNKEKSEPRFPNRGEYKSYAAFPSPIITSISDNFFIVQELLNKNQIVSLDDLEQGKKENLVSELKKLESHLAMPLIFKGSLIGIILAGAKDNMWSYSFEELYLLSTLLPHLSIAIENARLTQERLETQKQLLQTDKLKSLGTIAAGIAHEIKNPLTALSGFVKIAEERYLDKDAQFFKDFNEVVPEQIERIKRMAEGLSRYGKESSSEKKLVNVNNTIEKVLRLFEGTCDRKKIKIVKQLVSLEEIPLIKANEEELEQVFTNLILNAIDAMQGGGTLTITTSTKAKFNVEISISDTGTGIPADKLTNIFKPFYTTKEEGSGLGLAIVKKIIDGHGGKVGVESTLGKGSKFVVSL